MAETLEDIIERATNPTNIGDNSSHAVTFATHVNKEFDGPPRAIKILSHKLGLHQEAVSLQTLNVLECCVKSCGQRFHQEIGKYRFLNELIKLLSPKYDGDITSQAVKTRVIEMMYNWHIGLPQETKITEAYKMLKQQGVIKRDPKCGETESQPSARPTNTALDDEEKSKLLSTLLRSSNPDDLQAANRLIKTMVKQEEERLEKFSKRVQELETVSNNVALLNEMTSAYTPAMCESDQMLMRDLYEGCLNMRTQLFRMASQSAEDKDDTLSEILSLSDDLTKTIDEYKRVVIHGGEPTKIIQGDTQAENTSPEGDAGSMPLTSLLDLGLDPPTESIAADGLNQSEKGAPSSLLDEQFKMLGLDGDLPVVNMQGNTTEDEWGSFGAATQQQAHPQQIPQIPAMHHQGQFQPTNQLNLNFGAANAMRQAAPPPQGFMRPGNFNMAMSGTAQPNRPVTSLAGIAQTRGVATTSKQRDTKTMSNDLLGFDVFAGFKKDAAATEKSAVEAKKDNLVDLLGDGTTQNEFIASNGNRELKSSQTQDANFSSAAGYFVPLDAIEPTSHSPITTLDKDGVKTILNVVKDKRESSNPNVIVVVFSTISTNASPISEFKIEVSVPTTMKIKLQTPSASQLPPFNPLLPPSAITQIMLVANPLKDAIRMQIRISYKTASSSISETTTIDNLSAT